MGQALPEGSSPRHPTHEDAPGIAALITAYQRAAGDDEVVAPGDVLADWEGVNLAEDALLITTANGEAAAYVDIDNRRYVLISVYGYVHPSHERRGLETALVRWGEDWAAARMDRAPEGARNIVQHYLPAPNTAARRLLEALGYREYRTIYKMGTTLKAAPSAPETPDGIILREFVPGQDERATYDMMEAAFRDHWSRVSRGFDHWLESTRSERNAPHFWHVAEDTRTGEILGGRLGQATEGKGWIGGVGVLEQWRQRGIAGALLARAFAACYARGVREVGLSVDSESSTGAPRLYTSAGMRVTQHYIVYRKELRPGYELVDDDEE